MSEFQYNYQKHGENKLTVDQLDEHFKSVITPGTTMFSQIVVVIKMVVFALYLWVRRGLIEDDYQREKQKYEMSRNQSQRGDLAKDDLD